jgi:hypothetical protein
MNCVIPRIISKYLYGGKGLAGKEKTMDDALVSMISAPTNKKDNVLQSHEFDVNFSFQRYNWYECQHNTQICGITKCCQVCLFETNKRHSLDVVICDTHRVRLCNGKPQPHVQHSDMRKADGKTLVSYLSWADPYPDMNCLDKFHQFYLPHFVKPKEHQPLLDKNNCHVCNIAVSSDVNKKKYALLGKTVEKRGQK